MNALLENTAQADPAAAARAAGTLEELLAGLDAAPEEILRLVPGRRAVFAGHWLGRAVVFHLALDPEEVAGFRARHDEQTRVHGYMGDGPFRVPEPIRLIAGDRVAVTQAVSGMPLLDALWQADKPERPALQASGAGWLAAHAAPTLEDRPVNRGPWRKWAEAGQARQPHDRLKGIEARVLQKMHALSRRLRPVTTWRSALGHGDFHPNNLIRDADGVTWGIDLGASNRAPIYRDIARFLVHAARRGMLPSGQRRFGVDAGGLADFARAFALTEEELTGDLPFFLCHELLVRVEHPDMPGPRIRHTVDLSEAMFEDLRDLLRD